MQKELAELLLQVVKRHERTSCSDENHSNGYTTEGRGSYPRCSRCYLLDVIDDSIDPDVERIHFEINVKED